MRVKRITTMVLVIMMVWATAAAAQGDCRRKCSGSMGHGVHCGGKLLDRLDLTAAQQAKVSDIRKDFGDTHTSLIENLQESRKRLHAAVHAPVYDEQAIRSASAAMASYKEEMAVLRGQMVSRIRGVLTEEQLSQLDEMRSRKKAHKACRMRCAEDLMGNPDVN